MKRAKSSLWDRVYAIVRGIPEGRVMTYGQISKLLSGRISAQYVGFALHACRPDVPWHRVVNARGGCSSDRMRPDPMDSQRLRLEFERVEFRADGTVPLDRYRWSPRLGPRGRKLP